MMTGQKIDRIVAIAALLVSFVGVIPVVYSFQDKRFFWETDKAEQQIQKQQNLQSKGEPVL